MSIARVYGGTDDDRFYAVCEDADYIYAVGYTGSEGQGYLDALIVKFNKADLSIAARKVYGGADYEFFSGVCQDADYVYAVGRTNSEGQGGYDALIVKFNKSDLSIAARKVYGGAGNDYFLGVCQDADYVYAVGYTSSEGQGGDEALIVKFNKADLSIAARKVYGGTGGDYFWGVCQDADYVYAVGRTDSEGQGGYDALIVKFNKADLSIAAAKIYGGVDDEWFIGVCEDADYVYAVGYAVSEGQGYRDALIVKFNKADLSIAARKVYGGADYEWFQGACEDADYIYAVGCTNSEGQGGYDGLVVKFNKADLSIAIGRVYGGTGDEYFYNVCVDVDYAYVAAFSSSVGQGSYDALIVKFEKAHFYTGSSEPAGFTCSESTLTLADSALTLADSALTLADSALTLADSALVLADSALTLSDVYTIGPTVTPYTTMVDGPTSWVWDYCDYEGAERCPRGDPTSWEWEAPVSGGPMMTPQGDPTSWDWKPE